MNAPNSEKAKMNTESEVNTPQIEEAQKPETAATEQETGFPALTENNSEPVATQVYDEHGEPVLIKHKLGRKPVEITDNFLDQVEVMASRGCTQMEIYYCLGMSETTYYTKKRQFPAIEAAFQTGKAKGIRAVSDALYKTAITGDVQAQKFYMKTVGQRSEKLELQHSGQVVIQIKESHAKL